MSHLDVQQMITFAIVAVAFRAVGRRLWGQLRAFRGRPSPQGSGNAKGATPASSSPLIQVQLKPPAHLKRPPAEQ